MDQKINLFLQLKARYYQDSLAALLAALPNVEIFVGEISLIKPLGTTDQMAANILLYESNRLNDEQSAAICKARQTWPGLKIILLVDYSISVSRTRLAGVDLVLPVNTTAGELLQSINRLAGRETASRDIFRLDPPILTF